MAACLGLCACAVPADVAFESSMVAEVFQKDSLLHGNSCLGTFQVKVNVMG